MDPPDIEEEPDESYLQDHIYDKIQFGGQPQWPPTFAMSSAEFCCTFTEFSKYLANKRVKTQFQNRQFQQQFAQDAPQILSPLSFYINGQTEIPIADLQTLIKVHGGTIIPVLDRKGQLLNNGFVIAGNLTPSKRAEFKSYKVVREEWILRSCEAGQLLDWRQFVLRPTVVQKHLSDVFDNGQWPGGSQAQPTLFDMRPKDTQPPSPAKSLQRRPKDNAQLDQNIPSYAPSKPTHVAAELLKDEEWRRKSTAIAPGFIDGYYKNSRLHHLSTWKAELPAMITNLTADLLAQGKHVPPQTAPVAAQRGKTLSGTASDGRCIMHVDFDCMFVSAGLLAQPELKGLPIAVCHATSKEQVQSSTSEIASCSYEARAFGVKNGMSLGQARKLCPAIQTMPYDFDLYASLSNTFYKILLSHADQLQPVSVDECYIEASGRINSYQGTITPLSYAEMIRDEVRKATSCEVSIGISHNLVLARLATKKAKPAKSFFLAPDAVADYLEPLPVDELPSVGYSARAKFNAMQIATIGDLLTSSRSKVIEAMGPNHGLRLLNYAKGVDPTPLQPPGPRKSVSVELNYGIRFQEDSEVVTFMNNLAKELVNRLNALAARGAHLTLKVMKRAADAPVETPKFLGHGVCDLQNATHVFNVATADLAQIAPAAVRMMEKFSIPCSELRGVALQMTKLESISFHSGQQRLNFAATKGHADKPTKPESNQSEVSLDTDKKRLRSPAHSPSRSFKIPTATAPKKAKAVKQVTLMPTKTKPSISKKATIPMQSKIAADGALQLSVKQHKVYYPDKVTDAELASIGIDPSFFRSIPYAMRQDTLSNARAELIRQDGEKAKLKAFEVSKGFRGLDSTSSEAQLERINLEELNKPTSADPMFGKLEDIDQIRTKLQAWVAYAGVKGPADKDVRKLETYLIRCLEQNGRSPDLERVALVLSWLQWVVSQQSEAQQKAWQTSFQDLKERIDSKVVKLRGRHLCL